MGVGTLSGGIATLAVSSLPAGSDALTGSYPGDSNLSACTSFPVSLNLNHATASITSGNLNQTYAGSPVSAIATTAPSNLSVSTTYNGNATALTATGIRPDIRT
jgi:hypothetical protein